MSNKATIIDPLDARWVCQNIADSFGSTYLTLISIIQGVALGIWALSRYRTQMKRGCRY